MDLKIISHFKGRVFSAELRKMKVVYGFSLSIDKFWSNYHETNDYVVKIMLLYCNEKLHKKKKEKKENKQNCIKEHWSTFWKQVPFPDTIYINVVIIIDIMIILMPLTKVMD